MRERRVGLAGRVRLGLDARPVREGDVGARIDDGLPGRPRAGHEEDARAVARPHEDVLGARRAVHEVPGPERPLLALDEQQALAREDEEVLLGRLRVVEAARPAGAEHGEGEADLRERLRRTVGPAGHHARAGLEDATQPEGVVGQPGRVPDVDDEPAVAGRRDT